MKDVKGLNTLVFESKMEKLVCHFKVEAFHNILGYTFGILINFTHKLTRLNFYLGRRLSVGNKLDFYKFCCT